MGLPIIGAPVGTPHGQQQGQKGGSAPDKATDTRGAIRKLWDRLRGTGGAGSG